MRIIHIFLATLILTSCSQRKNSTEENKGDGFADLLDLELEEENLSPLESVNIRDTLIISFEGTDYGEWGGHRETILLQRNEENKIVARFLSDTVPFDIIKSNGAGMLDNSKRVIVVDTIKTLNINEEEIIKEFIQRITELNLKGPLIYANAGNSYFIWNTNETLKIRFWNSGNALKTDYYQMKTSIFGLMDKQEKPVANNK